eukprot:11213656-Lingulodinium_polyedra.AAC.1
MRSSRPSAAVATSESHVRAFRARARAPENWRARAKARACDVRAVAAADRRFDRIVVQRCANVAQRCGRIDRPQPQRFVNRTFAHFMRAPEAPENWRARGVRERAISEPLRPRSIGSTA